jgi:hypothetical protein
MPALGLRGSNRDYAAGLVEDDPPPGRFLSDGVRELLDSERRPRPDVLRV